MDHLAHVSPLPLLFFLPLPQLTMLLLLLLRPFPYSCPCCCCSWLCTCLRSARAPLLRRIAVLEGHSGYSFADSPLGRLGLLHGEAARHHDWHHKVPTKNFGSIMWDELCGTIDPRSQRQH